MIDGVVGISSKVSASLCSEKMSGGTVVAIGCPGADNPADCRIRVGGLIAVPVGGRCGLAIGFAIFVTILGFSGYALIQLHRRS